MIRHIRVGIPMIGSRRWLGGVSYAEVLVKAVAALPDAERPRMVLVVEEADLAELDLYRPFLEYFDGVVFIGRQPMGLREVLPNLLACLPGWGDVYQEVDLLFPIVSTVLPGQPAISWIPDFQHVHLPQFFEASEIQLRDHDFQRIAREASYVVLSSHDAKRDYEALFPESPALVRVMNFHHRPNPDWYARDPREVQKQYGLPDSYLISCNQFWAHKNHRTLFEAIALLREQGLELPLVCTGSTEDYRQKEYFGELMAYATELGIADRLFVLGSIPRVDQIQLVRGAMALVQPSLFEGWSTVIEDARALGKRIFLSDLSVHREQNPVGAVYFSRLDARDLAARLAEAHSELSPGPDRERETAALAQADENATRYGRTFAAIAREAWAIFHDRAMLLSADATVRLPDSKAFNFLLCDENPDAFKAALRAYLEAFSAEDEVALHVLAGNQVAEIEARVLSLLDELGASAAAIPDVSILDLVPTRTELRAILRASDAVIGSPTLHDLARADMVPVFERPSSLVLQGLYAAFLDRNHHLLNATPVGQQTAR